MKSRWIPWILAVVLAASMIPGALAATVAHDNEPWAGNVSTPGVNSDPMAQAEMLRQLGLFLGTDDGFELDKPLTRVQAAVMLTRLLGGEEEALVEHPEHPFTDVPQWASPYVGWLYEQGLTKGVGDNLYGAHRNITFEEYATMLVRMLWGGDVGAPWSALSVEGEPETGNEDPFTRSAAVGLTVRALCMPSAVQEAKTTFQLLCEQGAFTAAELEAASWNVIASEYKTNEDGVLSRSVGGVTVAACPERDLVAIEGTTELDQSWFLATRREKNGLTVARLNCRTLEVEASVPAPDPNTIRMELVPEQEAPADGLRVVEVLKNGPDIRYGRIYLWRETGLEPVGTAEALWGADKLPPDGEALAPSPAEGSLAAAYGGGQHTFTATRLSDGSLLLEAVEVESGKSLGSYTVRPTDYDGDGVKELPSVRETYPGVLAGTAGAYVVYNGKLVQMTDQPVLSALMYDWRVGYAMMTYTPGVSPVMQGRQTGDEIWMWFFEGEPKCVIPAGSTGITLLDLPYDEWFSGIAPNGVILSYYYTDLDYLFPVATEDLSGLEGNLALWWEQNRLAGLGLLY